MLCLPNCSGLSKSLPAISHTSPAPIRRLQRSLWPFQSRWTSQRRQALHWLRHAAKSLELQHTIHLIREFDARISEIETALKQMMDWIASPILTIPGISYRMGAMILTEIGDFSRFDSPDKILAYVSSLFLSICGASLSLGISRYFTVRFNHERFRLLGCNTYPS